MTDVVGSCHFDLLGEICYITERFPARMIRFRQNESFGLAGGLLLRRRNVKHCCGRFHLLRRRNDNTKLTQHYFLLQIFRVGNYQPNTGMTVTSLQNNPVGFAVFMCRS